MITGHGTVTDAVTAMKVGAYDYLIKPFHVDQIRMVLEKITGHRALLEKSRFVGRSRRKTHRFENIIGHEKGAFTGAESLKKGILNWPRAAPFFSTRSVTSPW